MRRCVLLRKGSYFFVIDAFVAGIIVVGTIVALFSGFTAQTSASQAFYTAEDFLLVAESTALSDYDSDTVRSWIETGLVTDPSRTILQQIAYFNATGNQTAAQELANMTVQEVPENVGVAVIVGSTLASKSVLPPEEAGAFFSSKRIVLLRNRTTEVFNPVVVEVQTWQ